MKIFGAWSLVLSLTVLLAVPAVAKKHAGTENADDKKAQTASTEKHDSGNLDDILDGKIPPAKTVTPAPPAIDPPAAPSDSGSSASEAASPLPPTAAPKPRTSLSGNVQHETFGIGAGANGENAGLAGQGKMAPVPVLQGNASLTTAKGAAQVADPDKEDQELMIEWDRWRNRFLHAIQMQVQAGVNHPDFDEDVRPRFDPNTGFVMPRFPLGTIAWFSCEVTNDRRIRHLEITKSSGIPAYDRAVLEGVRALEGTSILNYPTGSHRAIVSQEAGIKTADRADYQYHHFGDVERLRDAH